MAAGTSRRLSLLSSAAAGLLVLVGTLVLLGWLFWVEALKSALPGRVAMNPLTAVGFMLAGAALWLLRAEEGNPRRRRWGYACGIAVALFGAARLFGYATGWDPGIDRILFHGRLGAVGG